jgi:hypothetical protein
VRVVTDLPCLTGWEAGEPDPVRAYAPGFANLNPQEPTMDVNGFRASLAADAPAAVLPLPLAALWWAAKGDWDKAHQVAQEADDSAGAWVHAYLHRVEGDLSNAGYWYRRAERTVQTGPLDAEWAAIATTLLQDAAT